MKNLDQTAKELFSKIRGRFPGVTIGDGEGNVTQEPTQARFFEFPFREDQESKISITLSEEDGVVIMHNQNVAENEVSKSSWYDFLREMRTFAKKRMLNFETRDITKNNLEKRDYQYLANRSEDGTMNESKLYGTSRVSYQNVDNARLVIKHTESINQETATGRTQKIGKIYVESADGERFMYPYKHLSGARAMARHVAEGGKPFDDFGKHITGLSEELNKLRKFKNYMSRSAVMAESLAEYTDVVKGRITTVKKTIESLQKPNYYKETFESFAPAVMEDVPSDVAENWIDQLTIKQFNEELADVFPYIYKLVSEASKAKELGPDELEEVAGPDKCWDGYKKDGTKPGTGKNKGKRVNNCVKEDDEIEAAFEAAMGQFSEASNDCDETCPKSCPDCGGTGDPEKYQASKADEDVNDANRSFNNGTVKKYNSGKKGPAPSWRINPDGTATDKNTGITYNKDGSKKEDESAIEPKEQKTPLGEFILSYFDREAGQFPKGETAVLTMIEKDYGEEFIEPAKAFIEQVNNLVAEKYGYREADEELDTGEYDRMRELAGLR